MLHYRPVTMGRNTTPSSLTKRRSGTQIRVRVLLLDDQYQTFFVDVSDMSMITLHGMIVKSARPIALHLAIFEDTGPLLQLPVTPCATLEVVFWLHLLPFSVL